MKKQRSNALWQLLVLVALAAAVMVAAVAAALAAALFPPWARIRSRVQVRASGRPQLQVSQGARRIRSVIPPN